MASVENFSNFLQSFNSENFKKLWDAQKYILDEYMGAALLGRPLATVFGIWYRDPFNEALLI